MKSISNVYDNDKLCDRYTVMFKDGDALAMSEHPGDPEGFVRWIVVDEYDIGQLGQAIAFETLPQDVKDYIVEQLRDN